MGTPILTTLLSTQVRYAIDQLSERIGAGISMREAEADVHAALANMPAEDWAIVRAVVTIRERLCGPGAQGAASRLLEEGLQCLAVAAEIFPTEDRARLRSIFDDAAVNLQAERMISAHTVGVADEEDARSVSARAVRAIARATTVARLIPIVEAAESFGGKAGN